MPTEDDREKARQALARPDLGMPPPTDEQVEQTAEVFEEARTPLT